MYAKRILSTLLALLMLVPALVACSDEGADTSAPAVEDTTTVLEETGPVVTKRADAKDNLPADFKLNGKTFTISTIDGTRRMLDIDGGGAESGDVVYDAVYARNRAVEDRLGVKLVTDVGPSKWQDYGKHLESTILAGDDHWQIASTPSNSTISYQRDYLFLSVKGLGYLDFEKPWWNLPAMEELAVDDNIIRFMLGDVTLSPIYYTGAVYFNKNLLTNFGESTDALYQTVLDRKWTLDYLMNLTKNIYRDVNGDGVMKAEDDIMAFATYGNEGVKLMEYALDYRRSRRDENGIVVMDYDLERASVAADKMIALLNNTTGAMNGLSKDVFAGGTLVIYGGTLGEAITASLRDMKDEYGVIPFPMLDDKQEEYSGLTHGSGTMMAIPITNKAPEEATAVLEALCSESYRSVVEVFYETALKTKYASDSQSGQCIDIIRAVSKKNFLADYTTILKNSAGHLVQQCAINGENNLASTLASIQETANLNIQNLVKTFKDIEAGK